MLFRSATTTATTAIVALGSDRCALITGVTMPIPGLPVSSVATKQICDPLRGSLGAASAAREGKIDMIRKYKCPDTPAS
jgi:hypothetical protein